MGVQGLGRAQMLWEEGRTGRDGEVRLGMFLSVLP